MKRKGKQFAISLRGFHLWNKLVPKKSKMHPSNNDK